MKKIVSCFLIILVPFIILADPVVYMAPYDNCFNVDLSGNTKEFNGAPEGEYGSEYGEAEMVGLMGVAVLNQDDLNSYFFDGPVGDGKDFTIEFSFIEKGGRPWMYRSASNPELMIPFGIDLVVRYNLDYSTSGNLGTGHEFKVYRFGYNDDSGDIESTLSEFTITPGRAGVLEGWNRWKAFWIDMVLVIPKEVRDKLASSGEIKYGPADDYRAQIKITITGEEGTASTGRLEKSFDIVLNGYFGEYTQAASENVLFNVTPNANSSSINLTDMTGNSPLVDIGKYYYSSAAVRQNMSESDFEGYESPFKMFVSSSSLPTASGGEFKLHLTSVPESNNSPAVNIPFEIWLTSSTGTQKCYTGADTVDTIEDDGFTVGQFIFLDSRAGDPESVTYTDEGLNQFRLTDEVTEEYKENLNGGSYSSVIYIHLSSVW